MLLVYPDNGLAEWLTRMLSVNVIYRLYTNNATPHVGTVLADLTEAIWAGYAPVTLTAGSGWIYGVSSHVGSAIAPPIGFTNGEAFTVNPYGYFITNPGGGLLLAAGRFDTAPSPIAAGGTLQIIPIHGDDSLYT